LSARSATPIDLEIGAKLRLFRCARNISQVQLAKQLGVTFQQVQKYERGANRIGSGRLYEAAQVLQVPVSAFFDDLPETADAGDSDIPTLPVEVTRLALRLASVESEETRRAAIERCDKILNDLHA
jgi:transcriptional regulator with XRE-family HTH domain